LESVAERRILAASFDEPRSGTFNFSTSQEVLLVEPLDFEAAKDDANRWVGKRYRIFFRLEVFKKATRGVRQETEVAAKPAMAFADRNRMILLTMYRRAR